MPLFLINEKGKEDKLEALRLYIYIDNSIIEVYANDRFGLSTRVYPTQACPYVFQTMSMFDLLMFFSEISDRP
jgi:sucrose-6-phosphate hydrolase SacC (GH32 family)